MKWPQSKMNTEQLKNLFKDSKYIQYLFFPKKIPNPPSVFNDSTQSEVSDE